jgi:N-acetylmuramoyl-L-alanine amidase
VTLAQRVAIANNAHVDLFVSVHCNANGPTARGFEVWYWRSSAQGKLLAQTLQSRVVAEFPNLRDRGLKPSAPGHSPLYVLHHTDMPSVLFECAFISNSAEEALLAGPAAQARFAQAIARAVLVLPCL